MLNSGVISIDNGGYSTCVTTKDVSIAFPTARSPYGNRTITTTQTEHDFIVEYKGNKYIMGNIAELDSTLKIQNFENTKNDEFYDLSVLVAIHRYGYASNFVTISVPISTHNEEEKNGIIKRLKGEHTITVNNVEKTFQISDVKISPESAIAFWVNQPQGKNRFLDIGSRTIGYATTLNDGKNVYFIDTESGTLERKGLSALNGDYTDKQIATFLHGQLSSKWNKDDKIYLLGGGALRQNLVSSLQEIFPNLEVMDNPQMVNSQAMYKLGCKVYDLV